MKIMIWLGLLLGLNCAHRLDPAELRLARRENITITFDERLNTPILVRGDLADLSMIKKGKRSETLLLFVEENSKVFKLDAAEQELRLVRNPKDELGFTHYRFERVHKGLPIWGDELIFHVNDKSHLYLINGRYHPSINKESKPGITVQQAEIFALEQGNNDKLSKVDKTSLIFYPTQKEILLAYHVILIGGMNSWDYFIDALNGSILYDQDRRRF